MKKRSGIRKGGAQPPGKKPTPPMDVDESAVMTLHEVADYLNCYYGTAYKLGRQGILPSFKLGSGWRFLKSEIDQWIAKGGATLAGSASAKTDGERRGRKPKPKTTKCVSCRMKITT